MTSNYTLDQLNFCYKGHEKPVLSDISTVLPEGEISLLLGPSGSGKSTLISILMNIIPEYFPGTLSGQFAHGTESLSGLPLTEMSTKIGIVFQNPESQFCTYTVEDEIAFGLENLNVAPSAIAQKINDVLRLLDITELKAKPLQCLSGGEKQKVAIAAVIACDPAMVIFDEPTANLDPQATQDVFEIIQMLKEKERKTILIVEHKLEDLTEKIDHLLVLNKSGQLVYSGSVATGLRYIIDQGDSGIYLPPSLQFYKELQQRPAEMFSTFSEAAQYLKKRPLKSGKRPQCSSRETIIETKDLAVEAAHQKIVKNIDLTVQKGDFVAIVGPNGAGKTTLFGGIMQVVKGASGTSRLFGKNIKKLKYKKWEQAGFVFQNPEWQFVTHSVEDELAFSLKNKKLTAGEKRARIEESLLKNDLLDKRALNPFSLSQGEKRRLSVAAVLIDHKDVILLDEPTYGQDRNTRDELMNKMESLNRAGTTLLMITHDMDLVYQYCNKVLLLVAGECRYFGDTQSFFENSALCSAGHLHPPFWFRMSRELGVQAPIRSGDEAIARLSI